MLHQLLAAAEKGMKAKLEEVRASLTHRGNRGASAETILRAFLAVYLPRRLSVSHGEIVDRSLSRSKQADVVVVNEQHPFTFSSDGEPGLFFIEGVSAVGEVKTVLTSTELKNTFAAARQYKKLNMILPAGALAVCSPADNKRYYVHPPYFLFAFESQLTLESVAALIEEETASCYSPGESIDGIFMLDRGYFIDLGRGDESFQIRDPNTKIPFRGWKGQVSDKVLFDMLAWLSIIIPVYSGGAPVLAHYLIAPDKKK